MVERHEFKIYAENCVVGSISQAISSLVLHSLSMKNQTYNHYCYILSKVKNTRGYSTDLTLKLKRW